MRLGAKPLPASGFALDGDLALTTDSATVGVCTITVFLVPLSSQPAAFPTAMTKMPPITAAAIAISAGEPGRARTDRTVAAKVLVTCSSKPMKQRLSTFSREKQPPEWLSPRRYQHRPGCLRSSHNRHVRDTCA